MRRAVRPGSTRCSPTRPIPTWTRALGSRAPAPPGVTHLHRATPCPGQERTPLALVLLHLENPAHGASPPQPSWGRGRGWCLQGCSRWSSGAGMCVAASSEQLPAGWMHPHRLPCAVGCQPQGVGACPGTQACITTRTAPIPGPFRCTSPVCDMNHPGVSHRLNNAIHQVGSGTLSVCHWHWLRHWLRTQPEVVDCQ